MDFGNLNLAGFMSQATDVFALALLLMTVFAVRDVIASVIDRFYPDSQTNMKVKMTYAAITMVLTYVVFTSILHREKLY